MRHDCEIYLDVPKHFHFILHSSYSKASSYTKATAIMEADKITHKIAGLSQTANYFSLEFFPPKTQMGLSNLQTRLSRMSLALRPLFVTVTWGAGGTTSAKSLELVEICQRQLGLTTCLHLTCTNMSRGIVDEALEEAKALGIRNILALRGDPPRGEEYRLEEEAMDTESEFVWAVDLVRYIRKTHGDYFCIGVAGYPEGHSDESYPVDQDPKKDMPYLVEKVRAGGDFIMTQLFYDQSFYLQYEELVRHWDGGILADIPIIPGLMPIQNYQILKRTSKLSHAKLPVDILNRLEGVKGDDEEVKRVGVEIISEMVEGIRDVKSKGPRGFHFYTLNLEKAVGFILERCHLIPPTTPMTNGGSTFIDDTYVNVTNGDYSDKLSNGASVRASSPHNHVNTDSPPNSHSTTSSTTSPVEEPSRATTLAITQGVGSLGREATWDDYPNGRFGDARSPAFGEIDGYGLSLHLSPSAARAKWGFPTSRKDISMLFQKHVMGSLDQLPWSESGLNEETAVIRDELCRLIQDKGWWSIASQPAVDGFPSSDRIFGWGPKGGFVFQKAFVEFFIPTDNWHNVLRPHLQSPSVAPEVSWYACKSNSNSAPLSSSSSSPSMEFESSESPLAVNAVTWGVFNGKEIVTPTIIEEVSFRAWSEEAFGIWKEWERCYPLTGATNRLLGEQRRGVWLVNVICHGYREPERLWEILLGAS